MSAQTKGNRFGTFGGVFTPCTLTILGVIMFLRYGEVVGQAGLLDAILILVGAKLITTLTALSLSAIATNTKVRGGGAYFLISRSLGVEFGGSIGIVFFLAQAVSVAMYIIGFTEALQSTMPLLELDPRAIATFVNALILLCVWVGAGWAIKVQYFILVALGLAIVSFALGAGSQFTISGLEANLLPDFREGSGFFVMFALFFPAVTGVMAGANMSGDLKDPSRAIPSGTLSSILVTGLVYLGMAVLLAGLPERSMLLDDPMVVRSASLFPILITVGVFAATLSSALGSMMGAPRILQAVARDHIFPSLNYFAKGSGKAAEPRRATLLTFVLAQAGILLGDLDLIAPIITMFFMVTYGYLNLATFYEGWTRNPSYRPTFRFSHWSLSLAGAVACAAVMVLISPLAATLALVLMGLLHWSIARRELEAGWGDVRLGALFERTRRALLKLELEDQLHPKNWRPNVLALSGGAHARGHLAVYGHLLAADRGLLSLGQVIAGSSEWHRDRVNAQERVLRNFIQEEQLDAFAAVTMAPTLRDGITSLVACHGLGAMRPNLILTGWSEDPERRAAFWDTVRTVDTLGRDIVVLCESEVDLEDDKWHVPSGPIDVWWRGQANGPLMLLLAHLLQADAAWRDKPLRLMRIVPNEEAVEETRQHLQQLALVARVNAEVRIIVAADPMSAIRRMSVASAVVFLGMEPPEAGEEDAYFQRIENLTDGMGTVLLVSSSGRAVLEA
jgi:amino acid transporter